MAKNTSITLGDHFNEFVVREVKTGRYGTVSEVVRAGLRLLETEEQKLAALRASLEAGEASGIAEGDAFDRARRKLGLKPE
jgi:antitoxin ParD1/3/4